MGADVNADIGCHNDRQMEEYKQVLGPNGLHKRNFKGKTLLHLYLLHNLRVTNTFYIPKDSGPHWYGTWTNILPTNQRATKSI